MTSVFTFTSQPAGAVLSDLVDAALGACDRLGLMVQPRNNLAESVTTVLERLEPALVLREESSSWPGSELHDGTTATHLVYTLNEKTADVLRRTAPSLYDWVNPNLPEDPHLLRADGSVWLGSTTHEEDAWLQLSSDEWRWISVRYPVLAAAAHPD